MANSAAGPAGSASKNEQNATKEKAAGARPEKPDEEAFKANLSTAEEELGIAQERMVSIFMDSQKN